MPPIFFFHIGESSFCQCHMSRLMCNGHFSRMSLTAEYFSNPAAEMLQEKVSAVPDGCASRIQGGADEDLLSDQPRLGLSAAPSIPSSSDPDQVRMESVRCAVY